MPSTSLHELNENRRLMEFNAARFELASLLLVVRCAENGSISKGALAANMSPMAASRRIRILESALAKRLFYRRRHGVELTDAGRHVVEHSRTILAQITSMTCAVRDGTARDVIGPENLGRRPQRH